LQVLGQGFKHAFDRLGNHESALDRELHGEVGLDAERSGHTVGDVLERKMWHIVLNDPIDPVVNEEPIAVSDPFSPLATPRLV
jgi:hypothetical protein